MHWLTRHRRLSLALICFLGCLLMISAVKFHGLIFADTIWSKEIAFRDELSRQARRTAVRPEFVFLGIDEASKLVDQVGPDEVAASPGLKLMKAGFPWSREVYALLLDRLCGAGAKLVLFDLMFNPERAGDEAFSAALERHKDRVVIGFNIDLSGVDRRTMHYEPLLVVPNTTLIPPPQTEDRRVGYINYFPDTDTRIRDVFYRLTDSQLIAFLKGEPIHAQQPWEKPYESFGTRALRQLGRVDSIPPSGVAETIRFGPSDAYTPISLYQVFVPALWEHNFANGNLFKDKIVLVGSASAIDHDVHPTPIGDETPGPLIHFHALAAALDHEFLSYSSPAVNLALLLGAGVAAWLLIVFIRSPLPSLLLLALGTAGYFGLVVYAYNTRGVFLLTLPVVAAFNLGGLFSLGYDFTLERIEKVRTRRTLERYVSKNLVKEILENPDSYYGSLRGVRIPVTILFSDIVGFTGMTESADPEKLVTQLNEYLSRMTAVVFKNEGTLDKFIGDAVMAVWGNVRSRGVADDAKLAARTALAMRSELKKLNDKWRAEGTAPFAIGIGLNQGEVLGGNIGSQEKMDPTVIGDSVNLASRLEALTRTYHVDILVGESATELVRDTFHLRTVARVQVKGKTEPAAISTLIGARDEKIDPKWLRWLATYEEGIVAFRDRKFSEAKILFSRFLEFYPDDYLAKMYLENALEFETNPPDAAWKGVEVFTKK